jgi:hypothetical protein
MEKATVLRLLALVQKHIAQGHDHIKQQHEIIARLDINGSETSDAWDLLRLFERTMTIHVADRDRLLKQLASSA